MAKKRSISLAFGIAAVLFSGAAAAGDAGGLRLQAGGFIGMAPEYEGSKDYQVIGAPFIAPAAIGGINDGMVQVHGVDDVRLRIVNFNGFEAGPLAGWRFSRDQSDSERLRGLGDVDGGLVLGGYAGYHIGPFMPFVSYHQDVSSDDDTGGVLRFGSEAKADLGSGLSVLARVGASYADDDYMDAYFTVTPGQSAASKAGLAAFDAESGIKDVFFGLTGQIPVDRNWTFTVTGTYSRLLGDAADSPVVETENQFYGGVGLSYTFDSGLSGF